LSTIDGLLLKSLFSRTNKGSFGRPNKYIQRRLRLVRLSLSVVVELFHNFTSFLAALEEGRQHKEGNARDDQDG
jgi:hypothetical protein